MVGRRVAALTGHEHLAPFEHRDRELDLLAVPGTAPVQQLGLDQSEERLRNGAIDPVADATHRRENFGFAQTLMALMSAPLGETKALVEAQVTWMEAQHARIDSRKLR